MAGRIRRAGGGRCHGGAVAHDRHPPWHQPLAGHGGPGPHAPAADRAVPAGRRRRAIPGFGSGMAATVALVPRRGHPDPGHRAAVASGQGAIAGGPGKRPPHARRPRAATAPGSGRPGGRALGMGCGEPPVPLQWQLLRSLWHHPSRYAGARPVGSLVRPAPPAGCAAQRRTARAGQGGTGGKLRGGVPGHGQLGPLALADVARHRGAARCPGPPHGPDRHGRGHHRPPRDRGGAALFRSQVHHLLPNTARPGRHLAHLGRPLCGREPGLLRIAGPHARGSDRAHLHRTADLGQRARAGPPGGHLPARWQCRSPAAGSPARRGSHPGPDVSPRRPRGWRRLLCFRFPRHDRSPAHQRRAAGALQPAAASGPPGTAGRLGGGPWQGPLLVGHVL